MITKNINRITLCSSLILNITWLKNKYIHLFLILILTPTFTGCSVKTQESNLLPTQIRATTPVMQDAKWAQKWWLPRHKSKIIEKNNMASVNLIFLGDSITHAWENKGKEVWQQYYQPRNTLNLGFSGDRTEHVIWRLQNGAVDNISPKLLVLMIGTNNVGHFNESSELTAQGIKTIISVLNKKLPTTKILLLAIFPRGETSTDSKRNINNKTNTIIKTFADNKHIFFLDINHLFLDQHGNIDVSIMNDYLHPNADQYLKWAQAIEPELVRLLKN